ncbi:VCBS repeat-containing protein [Flavimarina sp. Hel_I_48]|uniref:VCBS repeat-containing protein n=1 Tax=Flavimarina sp. Hel_I_48 TaxID=1392488 RepID=UPI0004DF3A56|nr:VCBS repeat-containing protein [Flavimarina sp. Hel_I_48]
MLIVNSNALRFLALALLIFTGCEKNSVPVKFELLPASKTGINFNNAIEETFEFNPINFVYIYNGSGVGTGDINNDGLPDLFFGGNQVPSKLYLNKGNLEFEDITIPAGISKEGWVTGVSFVDINCDNFMDIYVCIANRESGKSENQLYINQGNNTFKEKANAYGLNDNGYSTQAVFFDYDKDGDLDMYLLTNGIDSFNHNNIRPIKQDASGKTTDRLYRNNGDNTFTNVSGEAGITIEGYGLGVGILDVNNDGWPDVYCSNDFITNDLLWINNGDGTFTNGILDYIKQTSSNGMGLDIADYNNDGLEDIVQMDMLPEENLHNKTMTQAMNYNNQAMRYRMGYMPQYVRNTLQLRNRDSSFSEVGRLAGIHKTDWSWAPLLVDLDNDGLKDLFLTNGYGKDITDLDFTNYADGYKNPFGGDSIRKRRIYNDIQELKTINIANYFFKNKGEGSFENVTEKWSDAPLSISNGALYADLDLDGDLDLVSNNINEGAFIYKNKTVENNSRNAHFLSVDLEGPSHNPKGIGAQISLYYGDTIQKANQYPVRGYLSSVDYKLHFGLGNRKNMDSIRIDWPDGKSEKLYGIVSNQQLILNYKDAETFTNKKPERKNTLLKNVENKLSTIKHTENNFVDFQENPLLLRMLSREGPGIAVGDIDQDGLEDLLFTTALNDTSYVWMQQKNGEFEKGQSLPQSWNFEQLGSIMADFNNDGRIDIYVASGGSEFPDKSENYSDQLYYQNPDGSFGISSTLPQINASTATVNASDYDRDGDLDLFIGSRLRPNSYPLADGSYILRNDNGIFKDVTHDLAQELSALGMVTSALWTDFNNDGAVDLIIVGEWMQITFFENQNGKFKNVSSQTEMAGLSGFWNSINGGDFDKDGDIDYIVGNLGENIDLKATQEEPITIVFKDFDNNGKIDPIIGYYVNGINYPLPSRDALISQIASMKKRFTFYSDYGKTTFDQMFSKEELKGASAKKINCLKSIYIENKGNGTFTYKDLPLPAQIAPVYGISIADLNSDGNLDLLLTGNRTDTETLGGSLNSAIGTVLSGDGNGNFISVPANESGFKTPGDARGIAQLVKKDAIDFLVANNDGALQCFTSKNASAIIPLTPTDSYALIKCSDGRTYKHEFYFGAGYLSQNSRMFKIPNDAKEIFIFNSKNEKRSVSVEAFRVP